MVLAVVRVSSLAQELPYATGAAKKKKKRVIVGRFRKWVPLIPTSDIHELV